MVWLIALRSFREFSFFFFCGVGVSDELKIHLVGSSQCQDTYHLIELFLKIVIQLCHRNGGRLCGDLLLKLCMPMCGEGGVLVSFVDFAGGQGGGTSPSIIRS